MANKPFSFYCCCGWYGRTQKQMDRHWDFECEEWKKPDAGSPEQWLGGFYIGDFQSPSDFAALIEVVNHV